MAFTQTFPNGIKIHGFQTGSVSVSQEHFQYSGLGILRIPKILFSQGLLPPMPIWVWAIETPHGNYLIDTGETVDYYAPDHFKSKADDFANRRILEIQITEAEQINHQLAEVGLSPDKMDAVIMTHMHVDHTDGIGFFPKQPFLISKVDWARPIGIPLSSFPSWFKGTKISHGPTELPFKGAYEVAEGMTIISTPGHTFGHQSVLLDVGAYHVMIAGDTTFTESQLLHNQVGGITLDIRTAKRTLKQIQQLSRETKLIYLPSHDPESGQRLMDLQTTIVP